MTNPDPDLLQEKLGNALSLSTNTDDNRTTYMVAVDGYEPSGCAVNWLYNCLKNMKDTAGCEVIFIQLIPPPTKRHHKQAKIPHPTSVEDFIKSKQELLKELGEYVKMMQNIGVTSSATVVEDCNDIRETLCKKVDEHEIDVLILGHTTKSGIKKLVSSTIGEYCVKHAKCSVVVVKNSPNHLL